MKKKLLFIIQDLSYGGAEKVLVNLVNNLDKTKYDVYVHTLFDVGANRQFLNDDVNYISGFKRYIPKNTKLMQLFSPKTLAKWVIKDDYDLVISFLEGHCSRIVSGYNGKKIAWIHTDYQNFENVIYSFKSACEMKSCYDRFNKIICVSKTVKDSFMDFTKTKALCEVLYNVNETDKIAEKSKEQQDIIKKSEDFYSIISVGRLIPLKQYDVLIDVHKKLISSGVNNKLYILGEGDEHNNLQNKIDELNLNDTCKLLGFDENPYKYVSKADLFVCSSNREGFSTAVTEALVLGVPVVSTDVSGARELLGDNNEYGIVTEINEDALYDGVYKMLTEEELLAHYKKQAEVRGKEFSTEKTTKAVEKMLDEVLGD